ncbi:MAG TPA: flagellar FlbD family protein [Bryobacteraceae bacterium]|nr:flagellar FlbD family protein [Bryobacteraceae bacterium]
MIHLTRLNHLPMVLNSDLIQHIEATPDTVITLTSDEKIMVRESVDEVVARIISFRRAVFRGLCAVLAHAEVQEAPQTAERSTGPSA